MRSLHASLLVWALCITFVARAEAEPKDPPGYSQAVALGLAEFEDKNFAEARAHFVRAHDLSPSARTLRALGMVEFELKHYAESARFLSEALRSEAKPLDASKRAHAEQLLERANAYIGRLTLDVEPDTTLSVDGVTLSLGPGNELVLEVGDHALDFQAPARIAQKRTVTVRGGEHSTLRVRLTALKAATHETSSGPLAAEAEGRKERRVIKNPWLWTAVGIVVAGAAAGAAIALTRGDRPSKTEAAYAGTGGAEPLGTPR